MFEELQRLGGRFGQLTKAQFTPIEEYVSAATQPCDSGEYRKIPVTKVRGDANSKEGRYIDCGRSTDADCKGAFGGLASPPGETAWRYSRAARRLAREQRRRFQDVMNAFQRVKGGAIRKHFLFRPFDVGHPYGQI